MRANPDGLTAPWVLARTWTRQDYENPAECWNK